jgi:hypothetical protein
VGVGDGPVAVSRPIGRREQLLCSVSAYHNLRPSGRREELLTMSERHWNVSTTAGNERQVIHSGDENAKYAICNDATSEGDVFVRAEHGDDDTVHEIALDPGDCVDTDGATITVNAVEGVATGTYSER